MKSKVLVTGRNGQVGYFLSKILENRSDIEVLACDRKELDITNELQVSHVVDRFKPDFIVNTAAYTAVDKAELEKNTAFSINKEGPENLAIAAQKVNACLIHISTDYVFDGEQIAPYTEDDIPNPTSVYGKSKLAGEQAVLLNCEKSIIIRTAWVFGEHGNNFVKTMLTLGQQKEKLSIIDDQVGGPTYAGDFAKAIVTVIDSLEHWDESNKGVFHFSGIPHVSWFEFAKLIFTKAKENGLHSEMVQCEKIKSIDYPLPAKRPTNSKLDCKKICSKFGVDESNWRLALDRIEEFQSK